MEEKLVDFTLNRKIAFVLKLGWKKMYHDLELCF